MFAEEQATLNRIEEEAEIASAAFNQFRWQQTMLGGEVTAADKADLEKGQESLSNELNGYLAAEYGVNVKDLKEYDRCGSGHQPFNWFVEFYGIMNQGGFDVVVGNPPYVATKKVRESYAVKVSVLMDARIFMAW